MSPPSPSSSIEPELGTVLHQVAAGGSVDTLLSLLGAVPAAEPRPGRVGVAGQALPTCARW